MYSDLADYDFSPGTELPRFQKKHPILEIDLREDNEEDEIIPIFICPSEDTEIQSPK